MIACTNCQQPYPEKGVPYQCPKCGGLWDYRFFPLFDPSRVEENLPGIWRYRHAFCLPEDAPMISLGEGNTPLIWSEGFNRQIGFKLEFQNPSGSFKDRGTAVLMSFLRGRKAISAVEDSSGNAGASFAAYAARASIKARVYVPDSASGPKRNQIAAYGAEVLGVPGPRSNAAEAVRQAALKGEIYASHAYLPFNLPGYATAAYELWEQLNDAPGTVILPAGQGGLLLGISRGFTTLKQSGLINRIPTLVAVQARACAPLWALANFGTQGLASVSEEPTLAEGVKVKYPVRGDTVMRAVVDSGGTFVAVDEKEILPGRDQLSRRGFYVEPTSAIVWNALSQVVERVPEPIVVMLTGSGLKYSNS